MEGSTSHSLVKVHFNDISRALADRRGAQHVPRLGSKVGMLLGELLGANARVRAIATVAAGVPDLSAATLECAVLHGTCYPAPHTCRPTPHMPAMPPRFIPPSTPRILAHPVPSPLRAPSLDTILQIPSPVPTHPHQPCPRLVPPPMPVLNPPLAPPPPSPFLCPTIATPVEPSRLPLHPVPHPRRCASVLRRIQVFPVINGAAA